MQDIPLAEQQFCLFEGAAAWLVPTVWKTKEQGEVRAVHQCGAIHSALNAAAKGMGLTLMPCYFADPDPRVAHISDPFENLDMQLWVVTHPDLRNSSKVRAMMTYLYDEMGSRADLWGGRSRRTASSNLIPRDDW